MMIYTVKNLVKCSVFHIVKQVMFDLTATGKFMLNTDVHMRIKILKEDGIEWGNFEILRYVSTSTRETVTGIEVVTYNLENGKIVLTGTGEELAASEMVRKAYLGG